MVAKIANSLQNLLTQRETRRNRFPQVKYWLYERVQGVKKFLLTIGNNATSQELLSREKRKKFSSLSYMRFIEDD